MDYRKLMDTIITYNSRIDLLYGEWARKQGMSYYTMMILFAIRQNQPCTQKQIADKMLFPKQTINTVIKNLQKKGYVELTPGRNQKEKLIIFTEDGDRAISDALYETEQLEERVLKHLGKKECQFFAEGFKKFAEIFEEELRNYEK